MRSVRVKPRDLPEEFWLRVGRDLGSHSVALVVIQESKGERTHKYCGYGSLVRAEKRHFVLTAGHVWEAINSPRTTELRLPMTSFPAKTGIPFSVLRGVYVGAKPPAWGEWGPDIAFIEVPREYVGIIETRRVFYDLSLRRDAALSSIPQLDLGGWVVVGGPAEISQIDGPSMCIEERACFGGHPRRRHERAGYDFLDIDVDDVAEPGLPSTFGGMSGGGLWQVVIGRDDSSGQFYHESFLEGVTFWEHRVSTGRRALRCHGRHSIYRQGFAALGL